MPPKKTPTKKKKEALPDDRYVAWISLLLVLGVLVSAFLGIMCGYVDHQHPVCKPQIPTFLLDIVPSTHAFLRSLY